MIYEQIPNEFMIVPYEDRYFFRGSQFKPVKYDIKVFEELEEQRRIIVDLYHNKKLAKAIPKNIVEFYISKMRSEDVNLFYKKHINYIQQYIRPYNDKLYILPDEYIYLTSMSNGIPFKDKDKYISISDINNIILTMSKKHENNSKVVIAIFDSNKSSVHSAYILDMEYILKNIPNCVICEKHYFKYDHVKNRIKCHSCGFEIPKLGDFLSWISMGKWVKGTKDGN